MLRQVTYISTVSADMPYEDVRSIVSLSRSANAQREVTGLLFYNGRNFLQVLEGDNAVLRSLMSLIIQDPRHAGVSVLANVEIMARSFPQWSMRLLQLSESVEERRSCIDGLLPAQMDGATRRAILNYAMLN
ncbi:BLUF domain-containing protein [Croceicoccus sp. F390]|uniref:BLUF domain-containing protein n=1 Tax=Croceicoccus esteveae TaxID=3075597 RepID=A0ABU2ZL34_9SPHN|nr:BLUF domain-containing protein [Croceicoccus sp. F390]MDT0577039.1 BLUF domain-containing protein [Croceicoccus sp. F390]